MDLLRTSSDLGAGTDTAIDRLTGEFAVPDTERRYRLDLLRTNRHTFAKVTVVMALIMPCFSLVDLQSMGWGPAWAALLAARLAAAAAVLLTGRCLERRPETFLETSGRAILVVAQSAVFACALLACVMRPQDSTTNALSVTVLMLAAMVVVPGRFREQFVLAVVLCVALVVVSELRFDDPALPLVPLVTNLAVAVAWGALLLSFNNRAHRRQWASTERETKIAERLEDELAVAAELRAELQLLARQDPLTTAANRREFLRVASDRMTDRDGAALAMLLIDVDRFKSINDRFGHAAGDSALIWLVGQLRDALRTDDLVARVGGEEFAVLLPGLDAEAGVATAERLRDALAAAPPPVGLPEGLTVSIGVAQAVQHETVSELMARADSGMYLAKRGGGDAVGRVADPSRATSPAAG